jgi:hypothetical protein
MHASLLANIKGSGSATRTNASPSRILGFQRRERARERERERECAPLLWSVDVVTFDANVMMK